LRYAPVTMTRRATRQALPNPHRSAIVPRAGRHAGPEELAVNVSISRPEAPSRAHERGGAGTWLLVLLVLGGIAFAVYWFVLREQGGGAGNASSLAAKVVPAGADTVAGVDLKALLTNPDFDALAKERGIDLAAVRAKLAEAGMKPEDLEALVVALDQPDAGQPETLVAVKVSGDPKAAKAALTAAKDLLPMGLGARVDLSNVEAFDGGIVLAGGGPFFDGAVKRVRGEASDPGTELLGLLDAVDGSGHLWVAMSLAGRFKDKGLSGPEKMILGDAIPTHAALSVKLGSKIEIKGAARLQGGDAGKIADSLGGMLSLAGGRLGKDIGEVLKALEIGSKGDAVTFAVALTPAQLASVAKSSPF